MFQIKILLALCVLLALNPLHAFAQIPEEPCYEEDDLYKQEEDTYENEENPC
jgi:hypothetical protein